MTTPLGARCGRPMDVRSEPRARGVPGDFSSGVRMRTARTVVSVGSRSSRHTLATGNQAGDEFVGVLFCVK